MTAMRDARELVARRDFLRCVPAAAERAHQEDGGEQALADELLFGRLVNGGRVTVDLNEKDDVVLEFPEGDVPPPPEPVETVEIE